MIKGNPFTSKKPVYIYLGEDAPGAKYQVLSDDGDDDVVAYSFGVHELAWRGNRAEFERLFRMLA